MAAPINRIPLGLLDFFGIKSMGENPQVLVPTLQPTLDMFRWFGDLQAIDVFFAPPNIVANANPQSLAITNTGPVDLTDGANLSVPQNEVWFLLEGWIGWSFVGVGAAGCNADFGFTFTGISAVSWAPPMELAGFTTSSATINRSGRRSMVNPFVLPPGYTILYSHFGIDGLAAGSISPALRLRLARCRI